ncbi:MAG: cell division protein ZapB [Desulfovibrio sp.]|jgi:cell division protein ZapB|nr:cell division protein ZapB [Desulfovibrio sp.]
MEALEKLEQRIAEFLAKFDGQKAENVRIRAEAAVVAVRMAELEEENRRLRASLVQEEGTRVDALKRIDALLLKIEEHESIE